MFKDEIRNLFYRCFDHLAEKGVDAVVFGCTEIGLLVRERTWPEQEYAGAKQIALVDLIESHAAERVAWMLQR